ncbi:unnamed protein product [Polarella glacialis]|uniref:F-box domain-containing protein n=2 Tax=Polarella glacialis TaxID=89957 RepID=A0A813ERK7_POLGL|nr:unnamed protein product [Polarella glacialis]
MVSSVTCLEASLGQPEQLRQRQPDQLQHQQQSSNLLRKLPADTLLLLLATAGPLQSVLRLASVSSWLHDLWVNHARLHRRWAALLAGTELRTLSLASSAAVSGDPLAQPLHGLRLCRWLAGLRFSGSWRQQSFFDGSTDREELRMRSFSERTPLCQFEFELHPAEPPSWAELDLEDWTQPKPWPAGHRPGRLCLGRAAPTPPDSCLALCGYEGSGIFWPQQAWQDAINLQIVGFSQGRKLCLQMAWDGGAMGISHVVVEAAIPEQSLEESASSLKGTFINHDGSHATAMGAASLQRL